VQGLPLLSVELWAKLARAAAGVGVWSVALECSREAKKASRLQSHFIAAVPSSSIPSIIIPAFKHRWKLFQPVCFMEEPACTTPLAPMFVMLVIMCVLYIYICIYVYICIYMYHVYVYNS